MIDIRFEQLVPAVIQDAATGQVLMVAYMNQAAFDATLETGQVHFWSRSRDELWRKGATSGNTLELVDVTADCDGDTLLVTARPAGPVCHTGTVTCFDGAATPTFGQLGALWATIADRRDRRPPGSYTATLLEGGPDATGRKLIEEAVEVVLAAKDHSHDVADDRRVAEEAADLVYHLLVLLAERGVEPGFPMEVLAERAEA